MVGGDRSTNDEVVPEPADPEQLPISASVLQHALNAVLTYHHGQSDRAVAATNRRLIETMNTYLKERFFSEVFVLRPDLRETLRRVTLEPLTILHGGRGSGKTTTILYLSELIKSGEEVLNRRLEAVRAEGTDPANLRAIREIIELQGVLNQIRQDPEWYFYLDVESVREDLTGGATVCDLLYKIVLDQAKAKFENFDKGWRQYLTVNYQPLAVAIDGLEAARAQLEDLGFTADHANLADRLVDAWQTFGGSPAKSRLGHLLQHLSDSHGVAAGFAIDNIDLFNESMQRDVSLTLAHFCITNKLLQSSVVGIRTENLPVVYEALEGHLHLSAEESISLDIRNDDDYTLMIEVLERRLAALPGLLALPAVAKAYEQQRRDGYLPPDDPTYEPGNLQLAVDILTGLLAPSHDRPEGVPADSVPDRSYFIQLLNWHNKSMRAVCTASYHVGLLIASDSDPVYRFRTLASQLQSLEDGVEFGRKVRDRVRLCRGFFIRQFVVKKSDRLIFNHSLLLFEKPDTPVATSDLSYLRLHVLQALASHGNRSTIGDLQKVLAPFGASKGRVLAALDDLRQQSDHRRLDDRGLVHIDARGRMEKMPKDVLVDMLPAGEYVIEDLAYMSDYIFWNSYNTRDASDFLSAQREKIPTTSLRDEEFRISVALLYLENRILDRYLGIYRLETYKSSHLLRNKIDRATAMQDYLGAFGSTLVPVAIASGINQFTAEGRDLAAAFKQDVFTRTRSVMQRAQQPFIDEGLGNMLTTHSSNPVRR